MTELTIEQAQHLLMEADLSGDMDLLYDITRIVAETDSIGEGWHYVNEYKRETFDLEASSLKAGEHIHPVNEYYQYLRVAGLPIYSKIVAHIALRNFNEDSNG